MTNTLCDGRVTGWEACPRDVGLTNGQADS